MYADKGLNREWTRMDTNRENKSWFELTRDLRGAALQGGSSMGRQQAAPGNYRALVPDFIF